MTKENVCCKNNRLDFSHNRFCTVSSYANLYRTPRRAGPPHGETATPARENANEPPHFLRFCSGSRHTALTTLLEPPFHPALPADRRSAPLNSRKGVYVYRLFPFRISTCFHSHPRSRGDPVECLNIRQSNDCRNVDLRDDLIVHRHQLSSLIWSQHYI